MGHGGASRQTRWAHYSNACPAEFGVWGGARSGKLLNVRDASLSTVSANAEIQNIKQIMGLQHGKVGSWFLP